MQISQIVAASGQRLNCAVRTAGLLCSEKWELFMTLCGFCVENVSVLDAAWPNSGQNSVFPLSAFHRPGLQRRSVPALQSTWIYHTFISREVHFLTCSCFSLQLQGVVLPCPCLAVHFFFGFFETTLDGIKENSLVFCTSTSRYK